MNVKNNNIEFSGESPNSQQVVYYGIFMLATRLTREAYRRAIQEWRKTAKANHLIQSTLI